MAYYKVVQVYKLEASSRREALEAVRRDGRLDHLETEFVKELGGEDRGTGWLATLRKQIGL